MLKECVEVVGVKGREVKVRFDKKAMCSCCRYSFLCGKGQEDISIENTQGLEIKVGDKIEVGIQEKRSMLAALILFLFPMIIFLICLIVFNNWHQVGAFFIAILSVCVYYLIIRNILKLKGRYFNLKILRKL